MVGVTLFLNFELTPHNKYFETITSSGKINFAFYWRLYSKFLWAPLFKAPKIAPSINILDNTECGWKISIASMGNFKKLTSSILVRLSILAMKFKF